MAPQGPAATAGHPEEAAADASRRRFVRNLGLGGAAALGAAAAPAALLASPSSAQEGGASGDEDELPEADLLLLGFAETVEWSLVDLYRAAIDTRIFEGEPPDGPGRQQQLRTFEAHHREHGSLLRLVFEDSPDEPIKGPSNDAITNEYLPRIEAASDGAELMQIVRELEERMAATYEEILGRLESVGSAQQAASILPIEGQHAVAWGEQQSLPLTDYVPVLQTTAGAFPIDVSIVMLPEAEGTTTGTGVTGTTTTGATTDITSDG